MIIYGKQVCLYALKHHNTTIKTVYLAKKGLLSQPLFDEYKPKIKFLEERWAQSMSKGGNHQGILLDIEDFEETPLNQMKHREKTGDRFANLSPVKKIEFYLKS